jgi:hypothetical protein
VNRRDGHNPKGTLGFSLDFKDPGTLHVLTPKLAKEAFFFFFFSSEV